jgi:hypothetical protein
VHVYRPDVEWLIDAYARPGQFAEANRIAFAPMLATIDLDEDPPTADEG